MTPMKHRHLKLQLRLSMWTIFIFYRFKFPTAKKYIEQGNIVNERKVLPKEDEQNECSV